MKIPFDIKFRPQIEAGEYKVETRCGSPVRIICWDAKGPSPIIGLFMADDGGEVTTQNYPNGRWSEDMNYESDYDLFIVTPEQELTPLEDLLSTYLKNDFEYFSTRKWDEKKWNEVMRTQAAELLSLARKQLQPEIDAEIEKAYKTADEVQYRKGREEALKDLPRWKKCDPNTIYNTKCNFIVNGIGRYIILDGYMIDVDRLEKLPGFKEDE